MDTDSATLKQHQIVSHELFSHEAHTLAHQRLWNLNEQEKQEENFQSKNSLFLILLNIQFMHSILDCKLITSKLYGMLMHVNPARLIIRYNIYVNT